MIADSRMQMNWKELIPRLAMAIVALTILVAGCAHRPVVAADLEREALQQRENSFLAALGARDAEGTAAHFADDAVIHIANMPAIRGRSSIRQFYGNVFRFMAASATTPETLRISGSADMAVSTGRVTNTFSGEQGPVAYAGKYILVWERREGEWSVVIYAISNDRSEAEQR